MSLSRKDFEKLPEPEVHEVQVESLGQSVYMKEMSAKDQDTYEWSIIKFVDDPQNPGRQRAERDMDSMRAKYLVRMLCDKNGKRLFNDDEFEVIGRKKPKIIRELHQHALRINEGVQEEEDESGKNSNTESAEDSPSGSA